MRLEVEVDRTGARGEQANWIVQDVVELSVEVRSRQHVSGVPNLYASERHLDLLLGFLFSRKVPDGVPEDFHVFVQAALRPVDDDAAATVLDDGFHVVEVRSA